MMRYEKEKKDYEVQGPHTAKSRDKERITSVRYAKERGSTNLARVYAMLNTKNRNYDANLAHSWPVPS